MAEFAERILRKSALWGVLAATALALLVVSCTGEDETPQATDMPTPRELTDRDALVALYEATDGPNWENNTNWLSDAPLGTWYGVKTDESGRATELDLESNWLSGEIPPELGSLSNLVGLRLTNNQLTGEIPTRLGALTNLEGLHLDYNQLTGEIPPELGSLSNLVGLRLTNNQLTGEIPTRLGALTNLEGLYLNDNQLTGEIPPELGALTNLEWLHLANNQLTGGYRRNLVRSPT